MRWLERLVIELYVGRAGQGPLKVREGWSPLYRHIKEERREWSKTLVSNPIIVEELEETKQRKDSFHKVDKSITQESLATLDKLSLLLEREGKADLLG